MSYIIIHFFYVFAIYKVDGMVIIYLVKRNPKLHMRNQSNIVISLLPYSHVFYEGI
jgi:hypothetical protein